MKKLPFILLLLLGGASVAHAGLEPYSPLAVGLKWRHAVTIRMPRGDERREEMTNEITGTRIIDGRKWFVNVSRVTGPQGTTSHTTYFRPASDGVHTLARADRGSYDYLVTPLPLRPGLRWVSGRHDHPTVAVYGETEVDIGDRQYPHSLKVVAKSATGGGVSTSYMAPQVGTVLSESRTRGYTTKTVLRSMTYHPPRVAPRKRHHQPAKPTFHLKQNQPHLAPPAEEIKN